MTRACVVALGSFLLAVSAARADEPTLGLADLPAYRAALESPAPGPVLPATFRDLWDHPERFENRRVRVEATLRRRFRQGAVGKFPALAEAWAVTPAGDPFCLVFPEPKSAGERVKLGDVVHFEGTYLRRVRYQGSDAERLAPLIVGDRPPALARPGSAGSSRPFSGDRLWLDGTVGLVVALMIAGALVRQHLRKPPRASPDRDLPPEFVEPSPIDRNRNGQGD